jgi:AcrR family transcriptional regulator
VAAILSAAAQLLERRGYAAATTDAIARRAGVSVGSVYQYFPNKDAILVALVDRHMDEGFERIWRLLEEARAQPPDVEGLLRRVVDAMMALHASEPRLHRALFEEAPLPPSLRRRLERLEDEFTAGVAALLAGWPGLGPQSPLLAAHVVVRAVEGLVHGFILHPPSGIEADAFTSEVVALLVRYLHGAAVPGSLAAGAGASDH